MIVKEILNERGGYCICGDSPCVGHIVEYTDAPGKAEYIKALTKEEITNAVAQAWCHPKNEHKEMDGDLAMVIVDNILKAQKIKVTY